MRLLVLDNYDSFTYNLVHILRQAGVMPDVVRNDEITVSEIDTYDKILISPGPGIPSEAGIVPQVLKQFAESKDILGVCLGLQAIGECFGGTLHNLDHVVHGVATPIHILQEDYLFRDIPSTFMAGRYHSWVVNAHTLPTSMEITAVDDKGYIMAARHTTFRVRGVQFHPESVLTEYGSTMIHNWLNQTV
jgi:anthranilate synthase component 2